MVQLGGCGGRDGISLREPFRQPGKTALRFDPDGWSRRSSFFDHPNYERSAAGFAGRRCDLRSDRREAPRSARFLRIQRSDSRRLAARDAVPPMQHVDSDTRCGRIVCRRDWRPQPVLRRLPPVSRWAAQLSANASLLSGCGPLGCWPSRGGRPHRFRRPNARLRYTQPTIQPRI